MAVDGLVAMVQESEEWTSIGVKQSAKEELQSDKPEGVSWGYYLTAMRTLDGENND